MDILIRFMIIVGSLLMVYNIFRCYGFVKRMRGSSAWNRPQWYLYVPLALLIGFLLGYVFVGLVGDPDLVIAGILFGGSWFVFIVLGLLYGIIDRLREEEILSRSRYESAQEELETMSRKYLAVFHVNVTQDVIESRGGTGLSERERLVETFTGLMEYKQEQLVDPAFDAKNTQQFSREGLLSAFQRGDTVLEKTLCLLEEGSLPTFVRLVFRLAAKPETHDVMAFITEEECNDEMVSGVLLNKALIEQFDMITYLCRGHYEVVIGDSNRIRRGSVFPYERSGDYEHYLREQIAPVIQGSQSEREASLDALSLQQIQKNLDEHEPYEVNISCLVDGGVYYKRFVYYVVDRRAGFYLLLKSDTTEARKEEMERNDRLRVALEEARHASLAKTTFLSNMSHDIRTPMNAIVGYTQFALKTDDMGEVKSYLQKIDVSSQYLLTLINDVLEMSRIESGRLELELAPMNVVEVMDDLRGVFDTQMAEKRIAYEILIESIHDEWVMCDRSRLNRVLLNLLGNAYKFTPEGGSVTVCLTQLESESDDVAVFELRVKDTGIGMSEEFANHVFEAFERERNTTASGIQGTGLGMAITKRIVDTMGGTIEVYSTKGVGTEFVIHLAFDVCESILDQVVESNKGDVDDIEFEGKRILLAEDNDINREIATMLLEEFGFVVDEAVNGREAVDMLVEGGPGYYDIVVTDIQMPVMDGYEEARTIRSLDDARLAQVPIVAMSANAFQEDIRMATEAGMDGYISKPIDVEDALGTLYDVLANSRSAQRHEH